MLLFVVLTPGELRKSINTFMHTKAYGTGKNKTSAEVDTAKRYIKVWFLVDLLLDHFGCACFQNPNQ